MPCVMRIVLSWLGKLKRIFLPPMVVAFNVLVQSRNISNFSPFPWVSRNESASAAPVVQIFGQNHIAMVLSAELKFTQFTPPFVEASDLNSTIYYVRTFFTCWYMCIIMIKACKYNLFYIFRMKLAKDLGNFWLGCISMMGHLQMAFTGPICLGTVYLLWPGGS